jgi:hypothetical protein
MNETTAQVGGAKAGITFNANTTRKMMARTRIVCNSSGIGRFA